MDNDNYPPSKWYPDMRDYFAVRALSGLLASEGNDGTAGAVFQVSLSRDADVYARLAYELADAMLVERLKVDGAKRR